MASRWSKTRRFEIGSRFYFRLKRVHHKFEIFAEMIAETLMAEGIEVDKRKVVIEEPIKTLGVYNLDINLHPEVKAQIRVWVVKK